MRTVASHEREEAAQDAILVEAADRGQLLVELRAQLRLARLVRLVAEARAEELDEQRAPSSDGRTSTSFWYARGECRRDDPAVAPVGAQDDHVVASRSAGADDQAR